MRFGNSDGQPVTIRLNHIERHMMHCHQSSLEILFVVSGTLDVKVSFEDYILSKGDYLVINCADYHSLMKRDGDNVTASVYIDPDYFKKYFKNIDKTIFICDSLVDDNFSDQDIKLQKLIRNLLARMVLAYGSVKESGEIVNKLTIKLLSVMVGHFSRVNYYNREGKVSNYKLDKYYLMMQYMNEKYNERALLDDISKNEYLCKTYLSHLFKDVSAWSFQDMLSFTRIWKSEELLLTTDLSVSEISFKSGFSDPKYYYKNFKKYYNYTPSDFRKRFKNGVDNVNIMKPANYAEIAEDIYIDEDLSEEEIGIRFCLDDSLKEEESGKADFPTYAFSAIDFAVASNQSSGIAINFKRPIEESKAIISYCITAYGKDTVEAWQPGITCQDPILLDEAKEYMHKLEALTGIKFRLVLAL